MANLYLVATPIGNLSEFTPRAIENLKEVDLIACEDTRTSFTLLKHFNIETKTISYHEYNEAERSDYLLDLLKEGKDIAIISDAGYPLISDPGYHILHKAIEAGVNIVPISGANAAINALVASGLDSSHYLYYGFLNSKSSIAKKQLLDLESFPYTLIFYEAPHRIHKTLKLVLETLGDRQAVIARELTKLHEEFIRGNISKLLEKEEYKGELVLLVEGKKIEEKEVDMNSLIKQVKQQIKKGASSKEAIKEVAKENNISKNVLYEAYIKNN